VEFCALLLLTHNSECLNKEHVIISYRLAVLFLLTVIFAFGIGTMLAGQILALPASSSTPLGGDFFAKPLANVISSAAFSRWTVEFLIRFADWSSFRFPCG
jgi:hypothetical protein